MSDSSIWRAMFCGLLFGTVSTLLAAQSPTNQEDLLDLANGAVVISSTGAYAEHWPDLGLIDGTLETGWCSPRGKALPYTFVLELSRSTILERIAVNNDGTEESSYPGISARGIEVWLSDKGPDVGYEKAAVLETPRGARGEFTLPKGSRGQWLKLVVTSNWGREDFTELMELEAYGRPATEAEAKRSIDGVYQTNYGLMRLEQTGRGGGLFSYASIETLV